MYFCVANTKIYLYLWLSENLVAKQLICGTAHWMPTTGAHEHDLIYLLFIAVLLYLLLFISIVFVALASLLFIIYLFLLLSLFHCEREGSTMQNHGAATTRSLQEALDSVSWDMSHWTACLPFVTRGTSNATGT